MLDADTVEFVIKGSTGLEGPVELRLEPGPPRRIVRMAVKVGT